MIFQMQFLECAYDCGGPQKEFPTFFQMSFLECAYDCGSPQEFVYVGYIHGESIADTWRNHRGDIGEHGRYMGKA